MTYDDATLYIDGRKIEGAKVEFRTMTNSEIDRAVLGSAQGKLKAAIERHRKPWDPEPRYEPAPKTAFHARMFVGPWDPSRGTVQPYLVSRVDARANIDAAGTLLATHMAVDYLRFLTRFPHESMTQIGDVETRTRQPFGNMLDGLAHELEGCGLFVWVAKFRDGER